MALDQGTLFQYQQPARSRPQDWDQSLAVNMRGYIQNVANGNNAVVMINSEFRLPVFTTLLERPINNSLPAQFPDHPVLRFRNRLERRSCDKFKRPEVVYGNPRCR